MIGLHIRTFPDMMIDLASIEEIGPRVKKADGDGTGARRMVRISGQNPIAMQEGEVERLVQRPVQLLPAQPGTAIVHPWLDDGKQAAHLAPLIAWALCFDGEIRPVTAAGINDTAAEPDGGFAILLPTGQVVEQGTGGQWESVEVFLAEIDRRSRDDA